MFSQLPLEIEYLIWKIYLSKHVLPEIRNNNTVWVKPSDRLIAMTKETGAVQCSIRPKKYQNISRYISNYTDFERILARGYRKWYYENLHYHTCLVNPCHRCINQGFPCNIAIECSFVNKRLINNWKIKIEK